MILRVDDIIKSAPRQREQGYRGCKTLSSSTFRPPDFSLGAGIKANCMSWNRRQSTFFFSNTNWYQTATAGTHFNRGTYTLIVRLSYFRRPLPQSSCPS